MEYSGIATLADSICKNVGSVIVGHRAQMDLILASVIAGGHVLLEDVPGTGKTTMAKALAGSIGCSFTRVQFTPDLLPADVIGMRVYHQQTGDFEFLRGPVFTNILLADEINRATPRTQSALLECMEEKQVSEGGTTYPLPDPFLVIATQNPVETQGTFPLPEAQLDRFLVCISLGYPTADETFAMLRRFDGRNPLAELKPVASAEALSEARKLYTECQVSDVILSYIISLCEAARDPEHVRLGPSPRCELMLMRAAQALAAIRGRDYVIPDDIKDLALPVLAHRMILRGMVRQDPRAFITELL